MWAVTHIEQLMLKIVVEYKVNSLLLSTKVNAILLKSSSIDWINLKVEG